VSSSSSSSPSSVFGLVFNLNEETGQTCVLIINIYLYLRLLYYNTTVSSLQSRRMGSVALWKLQFVLICTGCACFLHFPRGKHYGFAGACFIYLSCVASFSLSLSLFLLFSVLLSLPLSLTLSFTHPYKTFPAHTAGLRLLSYTSFSPRRVNLEWNKIQTNFPTRSLF